MSQPETTPLDKIDEDSVFNGRYLRTVTGLYIDVFNPTVDMICEADIVHGLSNMPRWAGQTSEFYSVAQHSIYVALITPDKHKWAALWHDASEAYMLDMPRPLKREMPFYKEVEAKLMAVIAEKLGFEYPFHSAIKEADNIILDMEHDTLMHGKEHELAAKLAMSPLQPTGAKAFMLHKIKSFRRAGLDNPLTFQ